MQRFTHQNEIRPLVDKTSRVDIQRGNEMHQLESVVGADVSTGFLPARNVTRSRLTARPIPDRISLTGGLVLQRGPRQRSRPTERPQGGGVRLMHGLPDFNISRSDWWIVLTAHSNVLIEGAEASTDAVVATLSERLQTPFRNWTGQPPDVHGGTLVVRAVDARFSIPTGSAPCSTT